MSDLTLTIHFDVEINGSGDPVLVPVSAPRLDTTTSPWELTLHPFTTTDPDDEDVTFTASPPAGYTISVESSGTPSGSWSQSGSLWVSASIDPPQDHNIIVYAVPTATPNVPPATSTTTVKIKKPGRPFNLTELDLDLARSAE